MRVECADTEGSVWRIGLQPAEPGGEISISRSGLEQLHALLEVAEATPRCRVLVLEGRAGEFCRGMDLQTVAAEGDHPSTRAGVQRYADCLTRLRHTRRLVLAAVDGVVLGGGLGLAAAADLVIATRQSTFGLPELMIGLIPAMVMPLLLERMPPQRARLLALRAQSVDAITAQALGLVDELVDDAEQLERGLKRLLRNALRLCPEAVADLKRFTARVAPLPCGEGIAAGADHTAGRLAQPEVLAAIRALVAGEALPWAERYRSPRRRRDPDGPGDSGSAGDAG